ncbi:MAG: hypothetical protein O2821_00395 [Chloroflexi bacterium]|nr:hypothetical protein [Chloroflexota bacterium]MDA1226766.1 hypothetical protein [Chloroflexota bacterium]
MAISVVGGVALGVEPWQATSARLATAKITAIQGFQATQEFKEIKEILI